MDNLRLVMVCRDNYPQAIKAFTDDANAISFFEELGAEHVKDFFLSDEEKERILDGTSYEQESDDGKSVLVMEYVVVDE